MVRMTTIIVLASTMLFYLASKLLQSATFKDEQKLGEQVVEIPSDSLIQFHRVTLVEIKKNFSWCCGIIYIHINGYFCNNVYNIVQNFDLQLNRFREVQGNYQVVVHFALVFSNGGLLTNLQVNTSNQISYRIFLQVEYFKVINVPKRGELIVIDNLVCHIPVIGIYFKYPSNQLLI